VKGIVELLFCAVDPSEIRAGRNSAETAPLAGVELCGGVTAGGSAVSNANIQSAAHPGCPLFLREARAPLDNGRRKLETADSSPESALFYRAPSCVRRSLG